MSVAIRKPFNPRFQGTWIVRALSSNTSPLAVILSIPVFRGHGLLGFMISVEETVVPDFQSPFSGDMDC